MGSDHVAAPTGRILVAYCEGMRMGPDVKVQSLLIEAHSRR